MKTIKNQIIFLVIICCFVSITKIFSQNTIRVQDGKIFTSCNEEIVMRGVNEMFIWSQDRTGERILPEIAKTKSNAVRLVWTTEGAENEFDALINNSIKNKMIPVAELHDATGDFSKLQQLLDYWKKPAVLATIQKYKKWLIVNIGNEVGNGSESTAQWVNYYKDAITQLRDAGIDTPLMIDCGGYGNRESYFLEGGNELLEFDPLKNIIFAVHTYWTNGDDQAKVDRLNVMITEAKSKKLPYIIGEGPQKVASPVACGQSFPYVEMMKRLQEESIGWLSWSWGAVDNNDCGSPNSELDITTDGKYGNWATQFAEEMCVTDVNSIQNTSIIPPSMLDPSVASCGTTFTINASTNVAGGTISPSGNVIVYEGDNQIFDITSNIGFKIGDILVDGTSVGAVTTYTFSNVSANHTIKVIYEDVPLPPQLPYVDGKPQVIPGKIKATSFDLGGETVAYHDTTSGNDGDGIRQEEDVDTEFGGNEGNIGYTADGEWVEYTVNVLESGIYTIDVLVASAVSNGAYHIEFDGKDVTGLQNVSATGGWTSYSSQKISNIMLDAGEQVMRMFIDKGSFNFSTIKLTRESDAGGDTRPAPVIPNQPSFVTDVYRNMFVESGRSEAAVQQKLDQLWNRYFVNGDATSERLMYEVGNDMAYILDTGNDDIRSEGMSYGMMICVQLDKKEAFDKLWKFVKTYSQHKPGDAREGLFSWQLNTTDYGMIDPNSAPDGEEYFVTALFFADARWGSQQGTGSFNSETDVFNYKAQANYILDNMINKASANSGQCPTNLIDLNEKQIVFTPCGDSAQFTDPSYHLAAFYDLWALYADNNNELWADMATRSRDYLLPRAAHPVTGLTPDYSGFDGSPKDDLNRGHFGFDAWRVIMNMGFDFAWFQKSKNNTQTIINNQIDFFKDKPNYEGSWSLDGSTPITFDHNPGLVACNAVGSLALADAKVWPFVDELYELSPPSGKYRYYDGLLYMMSYMHLAGTFKIYKPTASENNAPIAMFTSSVVSGTVPLQVNFDASSSSDPDGDAITYTWSFDDGTSATGVTASHTFLQARDYNVTLTVSDGTLQTSKTKIISVRDDNTPINCTFNTPMNTALPSISKTYDYIFVLGNGPDLSNVTNFGINWGLANNGLWQLSMSTNNGSPSWWVNFLPKVTQNFNQSKPEITITGSGFTGLDGEYWAALDNGNFVLVSKTGQFTIYFSTTNVKPSCEITIASRFQQNGTIKAEEFVVWPNPVEDIISIAPIHQNVKSNREMFLFNLNGQIIKKKKFNDKQTMKVRTSDLAKGIYVMEIRNNDLGTTTVKKIIKK
ncbi:glycosyl hydrolase family 8 [Tenacibaculum jejuense]|uniref:cellulase n=1 Tax=Tenacibaculum jejuense TaxID=584609 RepID=A0A238UFM8_9FLAO|nr:glycosyl hydrolase family 8 [Tenacibaculum jejuense]SNR17254.1 Protein of unknown function containing a C-terminal secretion signal. Putative glycoside hydrolase family 8 [Tenacibaculum jejuense]